MIGPRFRIALPGLVALACAQAIPVSPAGPPPAVQTERRTDPPPVVALDPPVAADRAEPGRLPPVPELRSTLRIDVVYPPAGAVVMAADSTFLLGSLGRGDAALTINGQPVRVWPNGAWLAWVPLPADPTMVFRLVAVAGADTARLAHGTRRAPRFVEPARGVWIDSTAFSPAGTVWWPRDEALPVSVRAAEGAQVSLLLADGSRIALAPAVAAAEVPAGIRAFDRDTMNLSRLARRTHYHGLIRGRAVGADPGPILPGLAAGPGGGTAIVEAVLGRDTARARWPVRLAPLDALPVTVEIHDDPAGTGMTDLSTPGRASPGAAYHWFFPAGTLGEVTARINGDARLRLAPGVEAWVTVAELRPRASGTGFGPAIAGSVTVTADERLVQLRIPTSRQVPFFVDEELRRLTLTLYGTAGDLNWVRYGREAHPLLDLVRWHQRGANLELVLDLSLPVWGYRTRWDRGDLLLEIRRPPVIHPNAPLRGRRIVVDPGHPPGGSTGPTRLTEAAANLAVSQRLVRLLERAGADVIVTRADSTAVELWPRIRLADSVDADLLVSIHNNALPDGVNPFSNHGTSVFYNHPRSLPFARAVQAALVERLGLPDLGVARGDLALVRPTWMPAILTEGLFMIIPEQEAALRTAAGQERYAEAVAEGIRRFLLWHSGPVQTSPR